MDKSGPCKTDDQPISLDRYDKLEEAKKQARKKAELEQTFGEGGATPSEAVGSDSDVDDEDKITAAEEAGQVLVTQLCKSCV